MLSFLKNKPKEIVAIANSRMFPITEVKEEMFSKKMLGPGLAFELKDGFIVAPCSGVITTFFPTGHAFGIRRKDGLELLVHIGINTVELKGEGFKKFKKQGDTVKAGEKMVKVDLELLKAKGYDMTVMLVIVNDANKQLDFVDYGDVVRGKKINK